MSIDEARWTPGSNTPEPTFGRGRAPIMTYTPWHTSQETELGGQAVDRWYRRCKRPECRVWASPYSNANEAKRDGMAHRYTAHK